MIHSVSKQSRMVRPIMLAASSLCIFAALCAGGERIIVSQPTQKLDPTEDKGLVKESLNLWRKSPDLSRDTLTTPYTPPPMQNMAPDKKADERKWWMFIGPEGLPDRDKNNPAGGLRDSIMSDFMNPSRSGGDYMFYGMDDKRTAKPGKKGDTIENRLRDFDPSSPKQPFGTEKTGFTQTEGQGSRKLDQGAHTSRDLDLSSMFKSESDSRSGGTLTLHEYLRDIAMPSFTPAQDLKDPSRLSQNPGYYIGPGGLRDPASYSRDSTMDFAMPIAPRSANPTASLRGLPGFNPGGPSGSVLSGPSQAGASLPSWQDNPFNRSAVGPQSQSGSILPSAPDPRSRVLAPTPSLFTPELPRRSGL